MVFPRGMGTGSSDGESEDFEDDFDDAPGGPAANGAAPAAPPKKKNAGGERLLPPDSDEEHEEKQSNGTTGPPKPALNRSRSREDRREGAGGPKSSPSPPRAAGDHSPARAASPANSPDKGAALAPGKGAGSVAGAQKRPANDDMESYRQKKITKVTATDLGKTGGVYIPPFMRARLETQIEDKTGPLFQRKTWEDLKKGGRFVFLEFVVGDRIF